MTLPTPSPYEATTRTALAAVGAVFRTVGARTFAGLLPDATSRPPHGGILYELEGETATPITWAGAALDLDRAIDDRVSGRLDAHADRYYAALEARLATIAPSVRARCEAAGFAVWETGGGCTAWGRDLADGTSLLISSDSHAYGDPTAADWALGRYGDGGGFIDIAGALTLDQALAIAPQVPAPWKDGRIAEESYASVDAALAAGHPAVMPAEAAADLAR